MTPKAILFDTDGMLVDFESLRLRATRLAMGSRGAGLTDRDHRTFSGATDADLFRVLRILFDLDPPTETLVRDNHRHLADLIRREGHPMPGVPEVPRQLAGSGAQLGLVSASARPVIRVLLETLGLGDTFLTIVSGDEVPRGKPAPDGLLMAARRLAVAPEDCLVVEHSRSGVLAARAAGMAVAAVPCPITSHEDFSPADLVLPTLLALPKALGWNGAVEPGGMGDGS